MRLTSLPRLLAFGLSVPAVLMWPKTPPPDLNDHNIKQVSGHYACQRWPMSGRSDRVGGIRYASEFSHVFGYMNPGLCFEQLDGRGVVVRYVETPSPNPPLMLSLQDSETGRVWGASEADRLKRWRTYLAQPWWFHVWQGIAVLVLALLFFPSHFRRSLAVIGRVTRQRD